LVVLACFNNVRRIVFLRRSDELGDGVVDIVEGFVDVNSNIWKAKEILEHSDHNLYEVEGIR
jgi:hypothetical protein